MDKQDSAVAFALYTFRDCGIIARDRSVRLFLRRAFQSDHLSRTQPDIAGSRRESCGRLGPIVRHLFRLVCIIIARAARIKSLSRVSSHHGIRVSHFFITIYEIVIKPRELAADRKSREDDAVKSRTLLFLAKTISFYSFLFRRYNVAISAIIPIRTNNHLRRDWASLGSCDPRYTLCNKSLEKHARPCCIR